MAKIKLNKVLKEGLKEAEEREKIKHEMKSYVKKMDENLNKLRKLMRRDGYNV